MNYRHAYHAGNFADVFKHIVLVGLLQSLQRKETPFCILDTHAGIGCYDLTSTEATKTEEFESGIAKLIRAKNPPPLIQDYLNCITPLNEKSTLRFYPGSPAIAKMFLRPHDRLILTELHKEDYQQLKTYFAHDAQIAVHHQDGYQALKAFLPPKERRGLVLIDPPYEQPDEFEKIYRVLQQAISRWETGIFALWYPIKERRATDRFLDKLKSSIAKPTIHLELNLFTDNLPTHLNGSGMFIVNPPWQLDEKIQTILPWLKGNLHDTVEK